MTAALRDAMFAALQDYGQYLAARDASAEWTDEDEELHLMAWTIALAIGADFAANTKGTVQ